MCLQNFNHMQKLADLSVSVKDFGAKGDGVTDDTTAIHNAIMAAHNAGGGVVFLPAGTYRNTINGIRSNVHLIGAGIDATIIKQIDLTSNHCIQFSDASNCSIQHLTIDGNREDCTAGHGIELSQETVNILIDHVKIQNVHTYGIGLQRAHNRAKRTENITISNFHINGSLRDGIDVKDKGGSFTTTHRSRSSNVATLTIMSGHGLQVGDPVDVNGVEGTGYNAFLCL